jgi:hypothetical protein
VHGADVEVQDFILSRAKLIPSPILYMIIRPSHSALALKAMQDVAYIGCSTHEDWAHVKHYGHEAKAFKIQHSIPMNTSMGVAGFKEKYNITTQKMFLSCGGFWAHKAMRELVAVFKAAALADTTLVLTGYDNRQQIMPQKEDNILPIMLDDKQDVMNAIAEADLYIMHSFEEGFGLVLLEAMLNHTPWAARHIAGAITLQEFGFTYQNDAQLIDYMQNMQRDSARIAKANQHVKDFYMIKNTVDDILQVPVFKT